MKILLATLPLLCGVGCNSLYVSATKPDGTVVTVRSSRIIWSTESYAADVKDFGSLTATKSNSDAAVAGAIAEGIAKGLKQ